jgi:hypothetical protein
MLLNSELEGTGKEEVVPLFKVISRNLPEGIDQKFT